VPCATFLACSYSAADLSGKAICKRALQREMRLEPDPNIPLIGFIGRLDYQKGPDLVLDALPTLSNLDCQVSIQAAWLTCLSVRVCWLVSAAEALCCKGAERATCASGQPGIVDHAARVL
jgi:hypothetical protein